MCDIDALGLLIDWDGVLPVDPERIADKCGLSVRYDESLDELQFYSWLDRKGVIYVNPLGMPSHVRYSVAKDIGRFLYCDERSSRKNENCAKHFALALLMPECEIRQNLHMSSSQLCELFNVPVSALTERLESLRII